jgi:hypothetical protein
VEQLTTLALSLITPLVLLIIAICIKKDIKEARIKKMFSSEELAEAKRYAVMFGLANDALDIDIEEILKMGRKLESYIGSERLTEIHEVIVQSKVRQYFYQSDKQNGIQRRLHIMLKATKLVAASWITGLIRNIIKALGGDRNGEPSSTR